jgi:hypothetical protein
LRTANPSDRKAKFSHPCSFAPDADLDRHTQRLPCGLPPAGDNAGFPAKLLGFAVSRKPIEHIMELIKQPLE